MGGGGGLEARYAVILGCGFFLEKYFLFVQEDVIIIGCPVALFAVCSGCDSLNRERGKLAGLV